MTRAEKIALVIALASASAGVAPMAWRSIDGRVFPLHRVAWNEGPNIAVAFTPDGHLVTRTFDFVSVYAPSTGERVAGVRDWLGAKRHGTLVVSPRGDFVACEDTLYALPGLAVRAKTLGAVVAIAPDGDTAVITTDATTIALASLGANRVLRALGEADVREDDPQPCFSPDGALVAACSRDEADASWNLIRITAAATGAVTTTIRADSVTGFGFVAPRELAVADRHAAVVVFSAETGQPLRTLVARTTEQMWRSDPGKRMVVDLANGTLARQFKYDLEVRALETGALLESRSILGYAHPAFALSPDRKHVAVAGNDVHVSIWRR